MAFINVIKNTTFKGKFEKYYKLVGDAEYQLDIETTQTEAAERFSLKRFDRETREIKKNLRHCPFTGQKPIPIITMYSSGPFDHDGDSFCVFYLSVAT